MVIVSLSGCCRSGASGMRVSSPRSVDIVYTSRYGRSRHNGKAPRPMWSCSSGPRGGPVHEAITESRSAMERTQPPDIDEALRRLITQPSYGAQVLTVTARMLEIDAVQPLTGLAREHALDIAVDAILRTLPDIVCRDSMARA